MKPTGESGYIQNNDTEENLIQSIEKNVGIFSKYQTVDGPGENIPFDLKPAQQFLKGLGGSSNPNAPLSAKENKETMKTEGNLDLTINSFSNNSTAQLTIKGARIDRLTKSAKIYVNTDLFPEGLYAKAIKEKTVKDQDKSLCTEAKIHWQNLAVAVCHVQEIDLLVTPEVNSKGEAIAAPLQGVINEEAPAILLLSSPALNFGYGVASKLSNPSEFIEGMYRNLFDATRREGRKYIALPAAGLGVFGGNPHLYFKALMKVAAEFPELNIIYHPAQFGQQFNLAINESKVKNVVRATKDVVFIADYLTKNGHPCALHNPSDSDVVYGVYDIGEYWKNGKGSGYVGEEHIGAMSTAPMNSYGFNTKAYENVVERHLAKTVKEENNKENPMDVNENIEQKSKNTEAVNKLRDLTDNYLKDFNSRKTTTPKGVKEAVKVLQLILNDK